MSEQRAILLLADGTTYHGKAAGKIGTTIGEICFNTGMTGYQEIFTDPSYYGQILVATNAHIGNYGISDTEIESDTVKIAGLICKNFTIPYSRQQAQSSIQDYFEREGVVGISDVDTRAIVRHIRDKGAMNAIISSDNFDLDDLRRQLDAAPNMEGLELSSHVTTKEAYTLGDPNAPIKVAVLDLGTKKNILRNFLSRDCFVKVFPARTSIEEIREFGADGLFISNGPGDPGAMDYAVDTAQAMLAEDKPMFGICLGHQILARAVGIPTYKMHNGHRGINHPVFNLITGKSEITSQNHGFGVSPEAIEQNLDIVEVTHRNLNDDTIEGIRVRGKSAFSVQYHPEASPGPHDAAYLFDQFVDLIKERQQESAG
ncbi:glutamine-hydrolyzing carbamoyl-phosphate synthase small subunit [Lewinella sp. JB7]|uniref:glutamine-hydrolyzing carbamoyl-phosphate synthase small subunit n=1 Tax=Lewinella sp. JB7 TaxID=2962887 RepID=UPI0020C96EFF|nr:glutamine-hydrolyzing carbamoyl-phosphate synthase small subunit [Lewinella sp. JB7]MCP9234490.1 glutamine-hydrolyzing carbamoyl-phosphate synthase small subunit [Lewinella sp. JB7]